MMLHNVTIWDLILTPLYIVVFYLIISYIKNKHYRDNPYLAKRLIQGFWLKVIATILFALLMKFYYGYGDSFNYFSFSQVMHKAILDDVSNIIFLLPHKLDPFNNYVHDIDTMQWYLIPDYMNNLGNQMVVKVSCLLGFVTFQNYTVISILFSLIAYAGIWKIFVFCDKVFRKYRKEVAISFIFLPSFVFWGSGISKESICLYGIGVASYLFLNYIIYKKLSFKSFLAVLVNIYLLYLTKDYIMIAIVLGLFFALFFKLLKSSNIITKLFLFPIVLFGIGIFLTFFINDLISNTIEEATQELLAQSNNMQQMYENTGGSFIGNVAIEPTLAGIFKAAPTLYVNVFFRPYIWETRNPVMLLSALESLAFFLMFMWFLIKSKFIFVLGRANTNPIFIFSLTFSLVLGLMVGITTFNFGTIIRYKMPCMPFLCMTLLIINKYASNIKRENLLAKSINKKAPLVN